MEAKTLVIFEDARPELEAVARAVAERSTGTSVQVLSASTVTIPSILAADRFVLGAAGVTAPCWNEFRRIMLGINLAGRKVAFFAPSGAAVAALKETVADAELSSSGPDLVAAKPDQAAVAAWLKSLS